MHCNKNQINFHHKQNHVRCIAHIMNLSVQEILKSLKAGEAPNGDEILNDDNDDNGTIPKVSCKIFKC